MDPLFARSVLLLAGNSIDDNFAPHPDRDKEKLTMSKQGHRSLIQRASNSSHALGTVLGRLVLLLQRPVTAAPGSETTP
jgi:hypothetical protein